MGKKHASQYANFGSLRNFRTVTSKKLTLLYLICLLNFYFISCHLVDTATKIELSSHTSSSDYHNLIGFKSY